MKPNEFIPISYSLKQSFKQKYDFNTFKSDFTAALIVSLVALPLAMALSIAVGLPPQHGIYTAIVAGIIVPLFGSSTFQVSGPTAAFIVIVAPIVVEHGLEGLIITEILAGIFLILMGLAKVGAYIKYVPYPVITGFTSGIAVVIATMALNDFLGLHIKNFQGDYLNKLTLIIQHLSGLYWPEAFIGLISLIIMCTAKHLIPKIPQQVVGLVIGALLAYFFQQNGFKIATIENIFTFKNPDGSIGYGIPPFLPSFNWPHISEIEKFIVPALIITALAALESLLSAVVADGIAGTKHDSNSELVGIGIGNILVGLFAGIPATGAIARTATNIHSGAKTPLAAVLHAILIMLYVLLLSPMISKIPMSALAALLLTVAYRMSHYRQFVRVIKIAPKSDTVVMLVCFGLTVFIDMVAGVTAGIVLSCFLLIKNIANLTQSSVSHISTGYITKIKHLNLPDYVMVYHINGALFFATAEKILDLSRLVIDDIKLLLIEMERVPFIDMTGLVSIKNMILDVQAKNIDVIIYGNKDITKKISLKLSTASRSRVKIANDVKQIYKIISKLDDNKESSRNI